MPKLSIDTLGDLDGGIVRTIIDREIRKMVADLDDKAEEDGLAREVNIKIIAKPVTGGIAVRVSAKAKIPDSKAGASLCNIKLQAGVGKDEQGPVLNFQATAPSVKKAIVDSGEEGSES